MTKMEVSIIAVLFVIFGLTAAETRATSYDLNYIFNGGTFDTSNNYLTATFVDSGTNTVTLTLTSHLSDPNYYIQEVVFNVDPNIAPSGLTFTVNANGTVLNLTDIAHTGQDAQILNGGGNQGFGFDVLLSFPSANKDRFNNSDTVVLTITGTGITAESFDFLNTAGVANVAAHIAPAAIGNTINNVPIPAAVWLFGSGLLGMIVIRRFDRRRRSEAR